MVYSLGLDVEQSPNAQDLRKRELSSGVVALLCLVSMTDCSCKHSILCTSNHSVIVLHSLRMTSAEMSKCWKKFLNIG